MIYHKVIAKASGKTKLISEDECIWNRLFERAYPIRIEALKDKSSELELRVQELTACGQIQIVQSL